MAPKYHILVFGGRENYLIIQNVINSPRLKRKPITLSCVIIHFGNFSRFQTQDEHNASCSIMSATELPQKNDANILLFGKLNNFQERFQLFSNSSGFVIRWFLNIRICNPITHCISNSYNHFVTSTIFSPNAC